mgnify:CR=1 FL=1
MISGRCCAIGKARVPGESISPSTMTFATCTPCSEYSSVNTWARVRQVIRNFLLTVWRSGALQGLTEEQAFFVRCGPETMTQADVDAGRLICEIGIAPVKPAEFVIFRIQQKTIELAA